MNSKKDNAFYCLDLLKTEFLVLKERLFNDELRDFDIKAADGTDLTKDSQIVFYTEGGVSTPFGYPSQWLELNNQESAMNRLRAKKKVPLLPYMLILPTLLFVLLFTIYPTISSISSSCSRLSEMVARFFFRFASSQAAPNFHIIESKVERHATSAGATRCSTFRRPYFIQPL